MLHGPGDLRLEEVPDAAPGPGRDRGRACVAAVTCATDAKMAARGRPPGARAAAGAARPRGGRHAWSRRAPGVAGRRAGRRGRGRQLGPCGAAGPAAAGRANLCADIVYLTGAFAERLRVPARDRRPQRATRCPPGLAPSVAAAGGAARVRAPLRRPAGRRARATRAGARRRLPGAAARRAPRAARAPGAPGRPPPRAARAARPRSASRRRTRPRATPRAPPAAGGAARRGGAPTSWSRPSGVPRPGRSPRRSRAPGGEVLLHGGCPAGSRGDACRPRPLHYSEVTIRGSYHHTPGRGSRRRSTMLAIRALPVAELLGEPVALARGGARC